MMLVFLISSCGKEQSAEEISQRSSDDVVTADSLARLDINMDTYISINDAIAEQLTPYQIRSIYATYGDVLFKEAHIVYAYEGDTRVVSIPVVKEGVVNAV